MNTKREGINEKNRGTKRIENNVRLAWTKFLGSLMSTGLGKNYINFFKPSEGSKERKELYLTNLSTVIQRHFFSGVSTISMSTDSKNSELKVLQDVGKM
jgi:hypothetical protein